MPSREKLRHSGGIFHAKAIHDVDMARRLPGEKRVDVMATASRRASAAMADVDDFDIAQMTATSGRPNPLDGRRSMACGGDRRVDNRSGGIPLNENIRAPMVRQWTGACAHARAPRLDFLLERHLAASMRVAPMDGRQILRRADCTLKSVRTRQTIKV